MHIISGWNYDRITVLKPNKPCKQMTKKIITKKILQYLLLNFFISCSLVFFAVQIFFTEKTESLEGKQAVFLLIVAGCIWILLLTLSSLTALLNIRTGTRSNAMHSALSFFLAPALVSILFFILNNSLDMWASFFVINSLYFLSLSYFFFQFRKFVLRSGHVNP